MVGNDFSRVLLLGFAVLGLLPMAAYAESAVEPVVSLSSDLVPSVSATGSLSIDAASSKDIVSIFVCNGRKFGSPRAAKMAGFDVSKCVKPKPVLAGARKILVGSNSGPGSLSKPRYCTMEYAPVSCSNGVTYSNKCFARLAGQDDCDRIVVSSAATAAATPQVSSSGSVAIDASTNSLVKAQWAKQISAVKALHVKFKVKTDEAENEIKVELKNKCKRPQISAEAYYDCLKSEIKPSSKAYWHFGFAALVEKSQVLLKSGVPQSEIDAFVSLVKEKALAFETATTVEEKRKLVNEVTDAWKEFRKKAYAWMVQTRIDAVAKKVQIVLPELKEMSVKLKANGKSTVRLDNAIVRLEENLKVMTSVDATVTLRQKWVAASQSVFIINRANRLINAIVNGNAAEDITLPTVSVPAEVEIAEEASEQVSAEVAAATPLISVSESDETEVEVEIEVENEDSTPTPVAAATAS